jgi:AcrR family transcriptional regulator
VPAARRTSPERREEILAASIDLFAKHGLHGVTTRMLADAAGISEALLYRHWKSKDALWDDLQAWCLRSTMDAAERLAALPSGTSTLVLGVSFLVRSILRPLAGKQRGDCLKRMMLSSLVEDGRFARDFLARNFERYVPKFVESLELAWRDGDLVARPAHPRALVYFCHHLPVMLSAFGLPRRGVVDYGVQAGALADEATRFVLRGLGLTEAALERHYDAGAADALFEAYSPHAATSRLSETAQEQALKAAQGKAPS